MTFFFSFFLFSCLLLTEATGTRSSVYVDRREEVRESDGSAFLCTKNWTVESSRAFKRASKLSLDGSTISIFKFETLFLINPLRGSEEIIFFESVPQKYRVWIQFQIKEEIQWKNVHATGIPYGWNLIHQIIKINNCLVNDAPLSDNNYSERTIPMRFKKGLTVILIKSCRY